MLTVLEEGTDYTVTYKNNIYPYTLSPGDDGFNSKKSPKVTIFGTGSFCGRAEHCFTIGGQAQPSYTVRFDTNGGTAIGDKTDVKWTDRVLENIEFPKRPGYYFVGWKWPRDGRSSGDDLCRPCRKRERSIRHAHRLVGGHRVSLRRDPH